MIYVNAGQTSATLLFNMVVENATPYDPRVAERMIAGMCERVYAPIIRVFRDDQDRCVVIDNRGFVRAIQGFFKNEWAMEGDYEAYLKGFYFQMPRMTIRKIEESPIYLITMAGDFREVMSMCAKYPIMAEG